MVDYVKLQDTAQKILTNFGEDWVHRRVTKGTYDPANNTRTVDSTTNTTVKAARLNYKRAQVTGEVIQQGDIKLVVEAKGLSVTPTVDDKMVDGTEIWQIIDIMEINPGGTPVYYEMQLRQ